VASSTAPDVHTRVHTRVRDRWFLTAVGLLSIAITFAGFARTYFLKGLFGTPQLPLLLHLHGAAFTAWLVLFVVQVALVAARRTDIHRRLGVAGGALAAVMTGLVCAVSIEVTKPGYRAGPPPELSFLPLPLFNILAFAICVGAGLLYRRQSEYHKRFMLAATISILTAAISRLPFAFIDQYQEFAFFGIADAMLLACILYDVLTRRRVHPAYATAMGVLVGTQWIGMRVATASWWLAVAHAIAR